MFKTLLCAFSVVVLWIPVVSIPDNSLSVNEQALLFYLHGLINKAVEGLSVLRMIFNESFIDPGTVKRNVSTLPAVATPVNGKFNSNC